MTNRDDRRAVGLLALLALAGAMVRMATAPAAAPGAIGYRATDAARPDLDSVAADATRAARPASSADPVDVDRADAAELTRLPGIGPVLAGRIVRDREARGTFGSWPALSRVRGVGPALETSLESLVVFSSGTGRRATVPIDGNVSLNTASVAELQQLPGIGPARAQAIVDDRRRHGPYTTLEDLARVHGIGAATLARIRPWVRIR